MEIKEKANKKHAVECKQKFTAWRVESYVINY